MTDGVTLNLMVGGVTVDAEQVPGRSNAFQQRMKLVRGQVDYDGGDMVLASSQVTATPVVTTGSPYASGNEVGGLLSFPAVVTAPQLSGVLQSLSATCKSVQSCALAVYLFSSDPSNTTWTDKTDPEINALDVQKLLGRYVLNQPDSSLGTLTLWQLDNIQKSMVLATSTLYAVVLVEGTPEFVSSGDLQLTVSVRQD